MALDTGHAFCFHVDGSVEPLAYRTEPNSCLGQLVDLQKTTLSALAASYDAARALHEAGNVPTLDLVTEQTAYEQARIAVAEVEADLHDVRERLNVLLGLFGHNTGWTVATRLPNPPEQAKEQEGLEAQAIETSIELAEARARLTAQARRVGLTQTAGWMPDLNLGVHAERDGKIWEVGPALTGTLPLFDRQQGRVLSLESEFSALRERYVATAVALRAAIRVERNRLESAEERTRHYFTVILPLRERVVSETVLQYNAMQVGVFQLLQARRDQVAAARAYVETLREYWQARAALDQLLSGRLTGTMEQVMARGARRSGRSEKNEMTDNTEGRP